MRNLKVNNLPTKIGICLVVVCSLLLYSCNKTFDSEQELMTYVLDESNGYVQHKTVNGVDFTLMYRPIDLLVQQELDDNTSKESIMALREKFKSHIYFNLSISKNNKELLSAVPKNENEFGAMVNQLSFEMDERVHLFTKSKDTIEMTDFIYPRMYGMSRSTNMMFIFPRDKKQLAEAYLNFTVEDLGLRTGEVKFKINTSLIKEAPRLSFKEHKK